MRRRSLLVVAGLLAGLARTSGDDPAAAAPSGRWPTSGDFVAQAYADVLGHEPDADGLGYYRDLVDAGMSETAVLASLAGSAEHRDVVEPLVRLYYVALGRRPDTGGFLAWKADRQAGLAADTMIDAFGASTEFAALSAGKTDSQFVTMVFLAAYNRQPNTWTRQYWVTQLRSGLPRIRMASAIAETSEHRARRATEVAVHAVFAAIVRRVPTDAELTSWSAALRAGQPIDRLVESLLGTAEYAARFAAQPSLTVTTVVTGLSVPWGLAFTPDGSMLYTERAGVVWIRRPSGTTRHLVADLHDLFVNDEGGLLDVTVDPDFGTNRRIYTCHTTPADVRVTAWTVDAGYTALRRVEPAVVSGMPLTFGRHNGCRLLVHPADGSLWVTNGDAAIGTAPQDLTSLGGKVLRVDRFTGAGFPGNPFADSPNPDTRRIMTFGHRNVQGLAFEPGGEVFTTEHGTTCDDEINRVVPGGNYGWDPVPGYDESRPMTDPAKFPDARVALWSAGCPTIATSGATFLTGSQWGAWNGRLAVATLKNETLRLFSFTRSGLYLGQVIALTGQGRLRTVVLGPDGNLYVTTSTTANDRILRVTPNLN